MKGRSVMGLRATNYIKINPANLKAELTRKGISMVQASLRCGFSKGYLKECCKRGSVPPTVVKLLWYEYNIDPELYVYDGEDEPEKEKEPLDCEKLYQVLHDAVYTAVTKALKDE